MVTSFSILVPKFKKNNLIISHTIFPAYEWATTSGTLTPHSIGLLTLYGSLFVSLSWGVAATLFLNELYIGMSTTSCTMCVCCIVTVALSNHGKSQFSLAISSLRASEFLVLDDGEEEGGGGGGNSGKVAKRSLLENTLEEAMVKAHKLFAEVGDVETTFAAGAAGGAGGGGGGRGGRGGGGKHDEAQKQQQQEGKHAEGKATGTHSLLGSLGLGRTRSKRYVKYLLYMLVVLVV